MTANEASAEPDPLADPRVFRAVQEYQAELDAGRRPNRAAFLARHPEAAGVLSGCLRGLDLLVAVAPGTPRPAEPGGTRFEDYRVVRERGRGGLSVVYEAEQLSLRRRVALKVLSAPADATARRRFRNEAYAAASLRHPHIVPVYAVEVDAEPPFLVMPLVAGSSLAALVRGLREATGAVADTTVEAAGAVPHAPEPPSAERPAAALPGDRDHHRAAARLARQAADALQHAHESGIVHRDIKPGNLLVEPGGHLWVADFGMAKSAAAGDLTRTGEVVGTLRYMSPEQATGEAAVDHRTDVYALGVTLYELLTLRPAFPGDDLRAVFRAVASAEPPPPRRIAPAIPRELETVVLKAMAKERADRYATAAEFAADLQRFLDDRPVLARRPSPARRARKWVWRNRAPVAAGLATLVAVLIAGVVGLAVTADRIRDEQKQTAGANAELTKTVDERDGALRRLNQAHADQAVALRQARAAEYAHAFFAARAEWRAGNFARAADLLEAVPAGVPPLGVGVPDQPPRHGAVRAARPRPGRGEHGQHAARVQPRRHPARRHQPVRSGVGVARGRGPAGRAAVDVRPPETASTSPPRSPPTASTSSPSGTTASRSATGTSGSSTCGNSARASWSAASRCRASRSRSRRTARGCCARPATRRTRRPN